MLFVYLVNPFRVQLEDSHVGRVLKFAQDGLQWLRPKEMQQPAVEEQERPDQEQPDQRQGQQQPPRPRAPQRPTFSLNSHVNPIRVINSRGAVTTLLQSLESDPQLIASEVISMLSLLQRALRQVASNPDKSKFRRINVAKLESKICVQAAQAAVVFLQTMGFLPMQGEEEKGREEIPAGAQVLFLADLDQSYLLAHSDVLTSLDRHIAAVSAAEAQSALERAAYTHEMAEMFARGHRDRRLNFAVLKETAGDVDAAVRKLPQLMYRPSKPPGRKW